MNICSSLNTIQAAHFTYNVTVGRIRTIIVAVDKQRVLHILSVCL